MFHRLQHGARHICIQVVAEHLFHEGKFAVGEKFIQEAGIENGESLRKPFEAMHEVLKQVTTPLPSMPYSSTACMTVSFLFPS